MKLAIIGASGFVGTALLNEALQRGHSVTAIVRNPEKITLTNPNLTVEQGDAQSAETVQHLVEGQDAVLSAYNAGWGNPDLYADYLKGIEAIEKGTQLAGVKRLLVVGGAGSLEVAPGFQLVDSPQFPEEWKAGALAAREYLNRLRQNTILDWTFLSPPIMLVPGDKTGQFRIGTDQPVFNEKNESTATVGDLAVAVLDEVEQPQFIQKRFTLGY